METTTRRKVALSRSELRILVGLAQGSTYQTIAAQVHLAPATVAYHASRLQQRTGASNNVALVALAVLTGIFLPDQWPPMLSGLTEMELPGI